MASELNSAPSASRVHIGFFGKRNAGKSSVINAVTNQKVSIVSDIKGTTTDPVSKSMELLPLGPVVIIDTPGIDDEGALGALRVKRTKEILAKTDIAVLVVDSSIGIDESDADLIRLFKEKNLPYIIAYNKCDLKAPEIKEENAVAVSALNNKNIDVLKEKISSLAKENKSNKRVLGDLLSKGDVVVLVTPIDASAPKGRLILPQVQTIRDILDSKCITIAVQPSELESALSMLKTAPKMVVTDSQVFGKVKRLVPDNIPLTSFSILFARYKGILETAVRGAASIEKLKDGDTVLIAEGCTHHRQCEDIGTVKLPNWIKEYTGCNINFEFSSGADFSDDLKKYALIIHCGGCMLNEKEMLNRREKAREQEVPFTNYGTLIAYMNGILKRSLEIFPDLMKEIF